MIYRADEVIKFVAFYTKDGIGKEFLSDVTAKVYKIGTGLVAEPMVIEQEDGFYYCDFTPESDGVYVCVFMTNGDVDQKHLAGIAFKGVAGVNNLDASVSTRASETTAQSILINTDIPTSTRASETTVQSILTNTDVPTSTRATAQDVWQYPTRTLTSFNWGLLAPLITILRPQLIKSLDGSNAIISIYKGNTQDIDVYVVDADNKPVDITGATGYLKVAPEKEKGSSAIIQKEIQIIDGTKGHLRVSLTAEDTNKTPKKYVGEITITSSTLGTKTLWCSVFEIKERV